MNRFSRVLAGIGLSCAMQAWAADALHVQRLPHVFSPSAGQRVTVARDGEHWHALLPSGRRQPLDLAMDDDERGRAAVLLQADFNHDGHADIALIDGVGYGGALANYRVYLWDAPAQMFRRFPHVVGNPTLEPSRKALIGWERDGPHGRSTEYRSQNGTLALAVTRDQNILGTADIALDQLTLHRPGTDVVEHRIVPGDAPAHVMPEALPHAMARVAPGKVWLHDGPDTATRTHMYLIKGDTVTLLKHVATDADGSAPFGWLLVRFQGKKTIERWIRADSINP